MDKIIIENLKVFANHGVFAEETKLGQLFEVSLTLYFDKADDESADDLAAHIDYGAVCKDTDAFLKSHTYHLIEKAADCLACHLLGNFPRIEIIEVQLKKPWAPIGLPLQTVSVCIRRTRHQAFVALGSNLGDRRKYIGDALLAIGAIPGCRIRKTSALIETKAFGVTDQPDFLNGCIQLSTLLGPEELLRELQAIEQAAGRVRKEKWGPRTLDLDILFYDDCVREDAVLTLPHPQLDKRMFVLKPLMDIAPAFVHPLRNQTVARLYWELSNQPE